MHFEGDGSSCIVRLNLNDSFRIASLLCDGQAVLSYSFR